MAKKQLTQMEIQGKAWERAIIACFCLAVAGAAAPFVAVGGGGYALYKIKSQTQPELEQKATDMWRENGYEVTGFKGYQPGLIVPSITMKLTRKADGQKFEGTADCSFSCSMSAINAAP